MYTHRQRITAVIILVSHTLMSCWNNPTTKQAMNNIHDTAKQEELTRLTSSAQQEQAPGPIQVVETPWKVDEEEPSCWHLPAYQEELAKNTSTQPATSAHYDLVHQKSCAVVVAPTQQKQDLTTPEPIHPATLSWEYLQAASLGLPAISLPTAQEIAKSPIIHQATPTYKIPSQAPAPTPQPCQAQSIHVALPGMATPSQHQRLSLQQQAARAKRELGPVPNTTSATPQSFTAQGGHQVQFTDVNCTAALVHENVPYPFSRKLELPVTKQHPDLHLPALSTHSTDWQKRHIHIVFPEHSPTGQGYVYIGSCGLVGGGHGTSKDTGNQRDRSNQDKCAYKQSEKVWDPELGRHVCPGRKKHARNNSPRKKSRDWSVNDNSFRSSTDDHTLIQLIQLFSSNSDEDYKTSAEQEIQRMYAKLDQVVQEAKEVGIRERLKDLQAFEESRKIREESHRRYMAFLEGMLQEQVQRRLAAEQGIRIIHPGKCFVAYFSKSYVRRTKSYIQDFQEDLAANPLQQGLAPEQQKEAALIVNRIAKEVKKIQGAREDIAYFVAHPEAITGVNSRVSYDNADLEIADQLLAELQGCQEEMRQILAERGKDVADYEKKSDVETQEEKAAYRALEEALNDVSDTDSLVTTSQQAMKELLDKKGTDNSQDSALQPAAMQLATQVGGIIAMFKAKQEAINKLYFAAADISDYVNRPIAQGIQAVQTLNTAIDTLHSSFIHFYGQFDIDEDDIKPEPESVITKAVLKSSFKKLLAQLVPGSELVQAVLGSRPLPQNPEEWANLAVPAGFDFIPYHKTLKRLAGPDNPALQQQIKDLMVLLIRKRAGDLDLAPMRETSQPSTPPTNQIGSTKLDQKVKPEKQKKQPAKPVPSQTETSNQTEKAPQQDVLSLAQLTSEVKKHIAAVKPNMNPRATYQQQVKCKELLKQIEKASQAINRAQIIGENPAIGDSLLDSFIQKQQKLTALQELQDQLTETILPPSKSLARPITAVENYLHALAAGSLSPHTHKEQAQDLLKPVEVLRKQEKERYRALGRAAVGKQGKLRESLDKQCVQSKIDLMHVRSLRKRILDTKTLNRQDMEACGMKLKPDKDEPQTSDEDHDLPKGVRVPSSIIFNEKTVNEQSITIKLGFSGDNQTADNLVNPELVQALKDILATASQTLSILKISSITEILILCTTNGGHAVDSNHSVSQGARAIDISAINGIAIKSLGAKHPWVIALQQAIEALPNVRENFGPYWMHKEKKEYTHEDPQKHKQLQKSHQNHIHFSINQS